MKLKVLITAFCMVLFVSLSQAVFAAPAHPSVSYNGQRKTLTVENAQDNDLFLPFKQLVPGDHKKQTVTLRAKNIDGPVQFYLRSEVFDDIQLPPEITLSVYKDKKVIFEGPIDASKNTKEDILLHTFEKDGSATMTVILDVPVSVGNEIQNVEKHVFWDFIVQDSGTEVAPQTGDSSGIVVYAIGMLISGLGLVFFLFLCFKKRREQE